MDNTNYFDMAKNLQKMFAEKYQDRNTECWLWY